ncbi:MAG: MoaD/ThiS family protein [Planctomycetaceae bacterium]
MQVCLFAGLAEAAGTRVITLDWAGGSAEQLKHLIASRHPEIAPLVGRSVVAVGTTYRADDQFVAVTDSVALIPPVSGG